MKKLIAIVCVVMLVVSTSMFTGCARFTGGLDYAANVIDLQADSALIKNQYENIYNLVVSKQDSFTEEEWAQLNDIHYAFSETAIRIADMMKSPNNAITPKELRQMYELAYIGYTNAKEIIAAHKDVFTSYQWSQMVNFDEKAIEYDKDVRSVLHNPDTDDINKTLGLIITLGGAAYKFLLPVLVSLI